MIGQPTKAKRKSPGTLLGCVFPLALLVALIALISFLAPSLNLGDMVGLVIFAAFVVVLLLTGYLWIGPKDLLVTTAVLVGIMGACFIFCTVLFLLSSSGQGTTSVGG